MHPQHASSDLDKFETMVSPMMHHMCQTALQPERGDVACIKRCHSTLQDLIQLQYVLIAEGRKSDIVVMGEKGRAQLVRLERDRILSTVNDVNKMRITFSQVSCDTTFLKCCVAELLYFILIGQCDLIRDCCKLPTCLCRLPAWHCST